MKILLPNSIPLSPALPAGVQAVRYDVKGPIPPEQLDAEVLVAWLNPSNELEAAARQLSRLRWVQTLAAGPDQVLAAGFAPDVVITSGRSLHDLPVAEHTLALVLAAVRRLDLTMQAQRTHRWATELGSQQMPDNVHRLTTLRGTHVVIWGFGSIAATLAPHLTALGARITGVAHTSGTRAGCEVVATPALPRLLPTADLLVVLLPATPETRAVVDARVFGLLPTHAWVVNVGRGATVAESDLITALHAGEIAGAALDVADTEPLPPDSPLWEAPNLIITPHIAGWRPLGADHLIADNVRAFLAGTPLRNVVARAGGLG